MKYALGLATAKPIESTLNQLETDIKKMMMQVQATHVAQTVKHAGTYTIGVLFYMYLIYLEFF